MSKIFAQEAALLKAEEQLEELAEQIREISRTGRWSGSLHRRRRRGARTRRQAHRPWPGCCRWCSARRYGISRWRRHETILDMR